MTSDPLERYSARTGQQHERLLLLRIKTSGEILDSSLRILQKYGATFMQYTVGAALIVQAGIAFFTKFTWPKLFETSQPGRTDLQIWEFLITIGTSLVVALPLILIGASYSAAFVTCITREILELREPNARAAAKQAQVMLPALFKTLLRQAVSGLGGFVVSVSFLIFGAILASVTEESNRLPGLFAIAGSVGLFISVLILIAVLANQSLNPAVVIFEGVSAKKASQRSKSLMKSFGRQPAAHLGVLGITCLMSVLIGMLQAGYSLILALFGVDKWIDSLSESGAFGVIASTAVELLPLFISIWSLLPAWSVAMTLLYFDRRIRIEGHDIEVLTRAIPERRANRFDV